MWRVYIRVMIKIKFLKSRHTGVYVVRLGVRLVYFATFESVARVWSSRGTCIYYIDTGKIDIYVVRQKSFLKTATILMHELVHAALFILGCHEGRGHDRWDTLGSWLFNKYGY